MNLGLMKDASNRLIVCSFDRLYGESSGLDLDSAGRIRLDDWEMADQVQQKIMELWPKVDTSNLMDITNFKEYQIRIFTTFWFWY